MANIEQIDILELIPQRQPMIMVDKLVYSDHVRSTTKLTIRENNIFYENGEFVEAGIIENFAQTCAARMGYINKILNNEKVKLGFIGAIKNLKIYFFPTLGDEIETKIEVMNEYFNITLVNAKSVCKGKVIAECEMKISQP